jgi:hypothetical protein
MLKRVGWQRWVDSDLQELALKTEAKKIGFDVALPDFFKGETVNYTSQTWRHETVVVKGESQDRYRDLKTGRFIKTIMYTMLTVKNSIFYHGFLENRKGPTSRVNCRIK